MEWIESVALLVTSRARQGRSELRPEHRLHERIIASHVVGERLRRDDLVRPAIVVLNRLVFALGRRVEVFVHLVEQPEKEFLSVMLR